MRSSIATLRVGTVAGTSARGIPEFYARLASLIAARFAFPAWAAMDASSDRRSGDILNLALLWLSALR